MLPKKYFMPVLLLAMGTALIFLDRLLFSEKYSTISAIGYMAGSAGILYLVLMLVFRVRSVDYFVLRHLGIAAISLGVINVLLLLLNFMITAAVLPSLVVISFVLIFAGIGLIILPPYKATDEELLQLIERKANLIEHTIKSSPMARRIGWLVCGALGAWAGYLAVQQFIV